MAENEYRVWPDGTIQCVEDGEAYTWMSDDFIVVRAESEDAAIIKFSDMESSY